MSRLSDDAGVSLVEMLVVIVLTGMIGAVITTSLVTGMHDQTRITSHSVEIAKVRTTLDRMMREIRDADAIAGMTQSHIDVVQKQSATSDKHLDYQVIANGATLALVVDVTYRNHATGAPTGADPRQTLVSNLVNTGAEPVFSATPWTTYTAQTAAPGVDASTCEMTGVTPTTYAQKCVGVVRVHLQDSVPGTDEVLDVKDDVALRNAP